MKYAKIFSAFIIVQLVVWAVAHLYFSANNIVTLVVADTSYSMKKNFPEVKRWIENFETGRRYSNILIGTDKASLGELKALPSKDVIFRTSFGKLSNQNLTRLYSNIAADERILLSDGTLKPDNWEVIEF